MEPEWELYTKRDRAAPVRLELTVCRPSTARWRAPGSTPDVRRAATRCNHTQRGRRVIESPEEIRVPTLVAHLGASQASTRSATLTIAAGHRDGPADRNSRRCGRGGDRLSETMRC